jgi:hypothetical protein
MGRCTERSMCQMQRNRGPTILTVAIPAWVSVTMLEEIVRLRTLRVLRRDSLRVACLAEARRRRAKAGGEGGIRTRQDLVDSVSCRFHIASVAVNAGGAVAPCTPLHAQPRFDSAALVPNHTASTTCSFVTSFKAVQCVGVCGRLAGLDRRVVRSEIRNEPRSRRPRARGWSCRSAPATWRQRAQREARARRLHRSAHVLTDVGELMPEG